MCMPALNNPKRKTNWFKRIFKISLVLVVSYLIWFVLFGNESGTNVTITEISYSELLDQIDEIDELVLSEFVGATGYEVEGTLPNGDIVVSSLIGENQLQTITELAVEHDVNLRNATFTDNEELVSGFQMVCIVVIVGLSFWGVNRILNSSIKGITDSLGAVAGGKGGGSSTNDMTKSKAQLITDSKVRLTDVAGIEDEKYEVEELIDMIKNPKRYTEAGVKIPKGVLLEGGPGCGKTLLAKAMANEAGVPFYSVSGAEFVELYVGVGSARMRSTFEDARKAAKEKGGCIVFIDEIDAIAKKRSTAPGGGNDERESTMNQLLCELDGAEGEDGIIIMGATNRADMLDPAIKRPGRFDRVITIPNPDLTGREAILKVHSKGKKLSERVTFTEIAKRTSGFSGAELANVMNEAAILMVRELAEAITLAHIDEAIDRTMMGPAQKSRKRNERERRLIAFHEAGHAVVGLNVERADVVQKITIIGRKDAAGYCMSMPEEETFVQTAQDILDRICGVLGGRVAEEIVFNSITTGAHNDLEKAAHYARALVMDYGMSSLGVAQLRTIHGSALGGEYQNAQISDETKRRIDEEVNKILGTCYDRTREILLQHRDDLDLIANTLLEYDTITKEQIDELMEKRELIETKPEASVSHVEVQEA